MNTALKRSHHFTVDVEEYFQVLALEPHIRRGSWATLPSRLSVGMNVLLELLAEHGSRATFFVLGWVAQRDPRLLREVVAQGHEIASHGTDHRRVTLQTRKEFRQSARDSKRILEDVTGREVWGYRAPNFSIVRGCEWALEVLVEEGYQYDSSVFPGRRNSIGGKRDPHRLDLSAGSLYEIPPATLQAGPVVLPAGGGAYFRHLPYSLVRRALISAEQRDAPGCFYIHPWELDPNQPRVSAPFLTKWRHYGGLERTAPRLKSLLSEFRFQPIASSLELDHSGTPERSARP